MVVESAAICEHLVVDHPQNAPTHQDNGRFQYKVEEAAKRYLKTGRLFVLSANLKGPFPPGWESPWYRQAKRRKLSERSCDENATARSEPESRHNGTLHASDEYGATSARKKSVPHSQRQALVHPVDLAALPTPVPDDDNIVSTTRNAPGALNRKTDCVPTTKLANFKEQTRPARNNVSSDEPRHGNTITKVPTDRKLETGAQQQLKRLSGLQKCCITRLVNGAALTSHINGEEVQRVLGRFAAVVVPNGLINRRNFPSKAYRGTSTGHAKTRIRGRYRDLGRRGKMNHLQEFI
ncbi:MAG: hypothetical protein Q9159_005298 [Coniocarpon cinnabarinum]